jgi:subtilisin
VCSESDDDHDRIGHGTLCANLLMRVAPQTHVLPARVFGKRLETSPETIGAAIDWAVRKQARVINLSLATRRDDARDPLYIACARACAAGVILVAAVSGNDIVYPSAFDLVVSVDLADWDDPLAYTFSPDQIVECRSPGRRRLSRGLGGKSMTVSGSSFAAPNIAGIAALWLERWPSLDLAGLRAKLAAHAIREDARAP